MDKETQTQHVQAIAGGDGSRERWKGARYEFEIFGYDHPKLGQATSNFRTRFASRQARHDFIAFAQLASNSAVKAKISLGMSAGLSRSRLYTAWRTFTRPIGDTRCAPVVARSEMPTARPDQETNLRRIN